MKQMDFFSTFEEKNAAQKKKANRASGENGAKRAEQEVLSITELTRQVRFLLEREMGEVTVQGEISNYRHHSSGHHYFTLKDDGAQVTCVLFRGQARFLKSALKDGALVQATGEITVYEARGQYQMIIKKVEDLGEGALQARFEALKQQLQKEGLFDVENKKPLPKFPRCIGILTSPTGAAIQDMLNILRRRAPWVRLIIYPVPVQGKGAYKKIIQGIDFFAKKNDGSFPPVDTLVVTRGGGSLEDLWNFNEEPLARAIASCPLPIVSAVGHEIDFTISDFAADLRAPTPSAAAELIVPDKKELLQHLSNAQTRIKAQILGRLAHFQKIIRLSSRGILYHEPQRYLRELIQKHNYLHDTLNQSIRSSLKDYSDLLQQQKQKIAQSSPKAFLQQAGLTLSLVQQKITHTLEHNLSIQEHRYQTLSHKLESLSPNSILSRGYSFTMREKDKKPIQDAANLKKGESLLLYFKKGHAITKVTETNK